MIIITGEVSLAPDHREAGLALGREHSARSRAEQGCISHDCYVDSEDPHRLHFFERWADMSAVQAHFAVPESGAFVSQMREFSTSEPVIAIYSAEPVQQA